jgi:ELWxxDGT repeat protein
MFQGRFEGIGYGWGISDGTKNGTKFLSKTHQNAYSTTIDHVTPAGNNMYFQVNNENGQELWVSGGTDITTHMVKDIYPGPESSFATPLGYNLEKDKFYFAARDSSKNYSIWMTNGTDTGTVITWGNSDTNKFYGVRSGDNYRATSKKGIYFVSADSNGLQLCFFEPSSNNLTYLTRYKSNEGNALSHLTIAGDYLYYMASDNRGKEFWYLQTDCITGEVIFDKEKCQNEDISFNSNLTGDNGTVSNLWDFGDSKISTQSNLTHKYVNHGNYTVQLTTSDNGGCSRIYKDSITIFETPITSIITGVNKTTNKQDTFKSASTKSDDRVYKWTVTHGSIIQGQNTKEIIVQWSSGLYSATVEVQEISADSCDGEKEQITVAVDRPSSINSLELENSITIYPNPTNGNFSIDLSLVNEESNVQIVDALGRLVYSKTLSAGEVSPITLEAARGLYIVHITSVNTTVTKKLYLH